MAHYPIEDIHVCIGAGSYSTAITLNEKETKQFDEDAHNSDAMAILFDRYNKHPSLRGEGAKRIGKGVPFERIRRITGYLSGTLDKWCDAKKAEEGDRVKHGTVAGVCDTDAPRQSILDKNNARAALSVSRFNI